jgi:hypothetical protein
MSVIAVDPGFTGAIAVLSTSGELLTVADMPVVGEAAQRRVNAVGLADWIREYGPYDFAIIEQVASRPKQGVSSTFKFGMSYGAAMSGRRPVVKGCVEAVCERLERGHVYGLLMRKGCLRWP